MSQVHESQSQRPETPSWTLLSSITAPGARLGECIPKRAELNCCYFPCASLRFTASNEEQQSVCVQTFLWLCSQSYPKVSEGSKKKGVCIRLTPFIIRAHPGEIRQTKHFNALERKTTTHFHWIKTESWSCSNWKSGNHLVTQLNTFKTKGHKCHTSSHYFESFTNGIFFVVLFGLGGLKATWQVIKQTSNKKQPSPPRFMIGLEEVFKKFTSRLGQCFTL